MNLLTPTGYKNIGDVNIGDELIAYDINTGVIIINTLLKKELWTNDMLPSNPPIYQPVYNEETLEYEEVLEYEGMPSEEVFQETYGDWKFYEINGTWKLYKHQSIWSNIKVVHASDLQIGDIIYDEEDNDVIITSIVECVEPSWWRLEISGDHSYISDNLQLHNASRYWQKQNASFNWNATGPTNWGSASGVSDGASVPTSVDDVFFDGVGANGNINSTISATITVLSINISSGYTATMTHNAVLTIAGNVTLSTPYTIAGSSGIVISAASTITSNGKTWPNILTFSNVNTKTLNGNFTVGGTLTISNATTLNQTGTDTLSCNGLTTTAASIAGTAKIRLIGGTWSSNQSNGVGNYLELDGNISISNGTISSSTIKYISGTITHSGTFYTFGNVTLDVFPVIFVNGFFLNGAHTLIINSLLRFSGFILLGQSNKIFSGTSGFECATLLNFGIADTRTFQNGVTYTINSSFDYRGGTFISNHPTLRANILLKNGAISSTNCNFTRIDSSGGRTINTWNGTVTDCLNVRNFTDFQGVSNTIIN
jgi:hypothetical protein